MAEKVENELKKLITDYKKSAKFSTTTAALGVLLFILVTAIFPFKDGLFNLLYPKPASHAAYVFDDDVESGKLLAAQGGKWDSQRVENGGILQVAPNSQPVPTNAITNTGASTGNGNTSLTLQSPAGVQVDNIMVAQVCIAAQGGTTIDSSAPAGWTSIRGDQVGPNVFCESYWRQATLTDTTGASHVFTFTGTTGGAASKGVILSYANVNTTSPIDVSGAQSNTTANTAIPATAVTISPVSASDMLLFMSFGAGASFSISNPPANMTPRYNTGTSSVVMYGAEQLLTSSGPTEAKQATASVAVISVAQAITLKYAPGPASTASPNAGGGNYSIFSYAPGSSDRAYLRKQITPTNELYMRMKMKINNEMPQGNPQEFFSFASAPDSGNLVGLSLRTNPSPRKLLIDTGNPIDTGYTYPIDAWHCVEMHAVISESTGVAQVWVDGTLVKDSQNINTGSLPISWVNLGVGWPSSPVGYTFDDLAVNDTNRLGCGPVIGKVGPVRSNPSPAGLLPNNPSQVNISLATDVPASCKYDTKTGTAYASMPYTFSNTGTTSHSTSINGLVTGQSYSFYVRCDGGAKGINDDDFRISFSSGLLDTQLKPLILSSTYESVSVRAPFGRDENANNQAILSYRKAGDTNWKAGMAMSVDRRSAVTAGPGSFQNPYKNEWRGSLIGLDPNTQYEVQVAFTDSDGVSGGVDPIVDTITTRSENYTSSGSTYYVSTTGDDTNGNGSVNSPWRTPQKAANTINAGDTVIVKAGTYPGALTIAKSGTANNYITFRTESNLTPAQMQDGTHNAEKVILDGATAPSGCYYTSGGCVVRLQGSYIRFSGFEITGGSLALNVAPGLSSSTVQQDVIVENNYIHDQVRASQDNNTVLLVGNSYSSQNKVSRITLQGNDISVSKPDDGSDYVDFVGTSGGHVIRNNRITSTYPGNGLHGTDCIGGEPNFGDNNSGTIPQGGYFENTDIYGNTCIDSTDDGIEIDGVNMNIRVWDNTVVGSNVNLSAAPIIIGPTYIFRNVVYSNKLHWTNAVGPKLAESGTGDVFFYHNTFNNAYNGDINQAKTNIGCVQSVSVTNGGSGYTSAPTVTFTNSGGGTGVTATASVSGGKVSTVSVNPNCITAYGPNTQVTFSGGGGSGATATANVTVAAWGVTDAGSNDPSQNVYFRNNIIHAWSRPISTGKTNQFINMDYDLLFGEEQPFFVKWQSTTITGLTNFQNATGQELHGVSQRPTYANAAAGDFRLTAGSPGIDKGLIIPGFNDAGSKWAYTGSGPDMGAYELGGFGGPMTTPAPTIAPTPTPPGATATPAPTPTTPPTGGTQTTYYVSPSGSDTNAGDINAPFKTITKAVSVISAGGTILLRGGTYNEAITISKNGTVGSRITLKNYPGETPVLKGAGSGFGITLNGSNFTIDGLTVDSFSTGILVQTVNNVTIQNVTASNNGYLGIAIQTGDLVNNRNILIDKNIAFENGWASNGAGIRVQNAAYVRVTNNEVYRNGWQGILTASSAKATYIASNLAHNNQNIGIELRQTSSDTIITDNVSYDDGLNTGHPGTPPVEGDGIVIDGGSRNVVKRNYVTNSRRHCMTIVTDAGDSGNVMEHNTLYKCNSGIFMQGNTNVQDAVVRNNIIYGIMTGGNGFEQQSGTAITGYSCDHNLIDVGGMGGTAVRAPVTCSSTVVGNPLFTNIPTRDFTIQAGSPAIDKGVVIAGVNDGYTGAAPDLGAFEFGTQIGPIPTMVPSPTPVPTPAPCVITSASWVGSNPILENKQMTLTASGAGACDGQAVTFNIRRNVVMLPDEDITTLTANFVGNTATTNWTTTWTNACTLGLTCDPEYFFNASVANGAPVRSNDPLLTVNSANTNVPTPTPTPTPSPSATTVITSNPPSAVFSLDKGSSSSFDTNTNIPVKVMVRSDVDSANLFVAKLNFDPDLLKVVSIDKTGSFISNWVEEFYDNTTGEISLTGGTPTPGIQTSGVDVEFVTIVFQGKAPTQVAALTFNPATGIYRDTDNSNILVNSYGTFFELTGQPATTPTPTAQPTAAPTTAPTAVPTVEPTTEPTSNPTNGPTTAPTTASTTAPTTAPTSAPVACAITSANWATNNTIQGATLSLTVTGTNCDGKQVAFKVRENDSILEGGLDDDAQLQPQSATFVGNAAVTTWTAEYVQDGLGGLFDPPEYFFEATIVGDSNSVRSQDPLLTVTKAAIGGVAKGDGNGDGQVSIVDLSVLFSYFCSTESNCKANRPAAMDFNDDGLINVFDFSRMVDLLIQNGVLRASSN